MVARASAHSLLANPFRITNHTKARFFRSAALVLMVARASAHSLLANPFRITNHTKAHCFRSAALVLMMARASAHSLLANPFRITNHTKARFQVSCTGSYGGKSICAFPTSTPVQTSPQAILLKPTTFRSVALNQSLQKYHKDTCTFPTCCHACSDYTQNRSTMQALLARTIWNVFPITLLFMLFLLIEGNPVCLVMLWLIPARRDKVCPQYRVRNWNNTNTLQTQQKPFGPLENSCTMCPHFFWPKLIRSLLRYWANADITCSYDITIIMLVSLHFIL